MTSACNICNDEIANGECSVCRKRVCPGCSHRTAKRVVCVDCYDEDLDGDMEDLLTEGLTDFLVQLNMQPLLC